MTLWAKTGQMIADHPLAGVGLGNFRQVFETQYHPEIANDQRRGVHAHNLWLHTAGEVGIPAALCYAAIWFGILWMAGRAASRRPSAVTLGTLLAIAAAFAANMTDNVAAQSAGTRVFLLIWTIFGLAAASDPPHSARR
jgi:O-antigen ligase